MKCIKKKNKKIKKLKRKILEKAKAKNFSCLKSKLHKKAHLISQKKIYTPPKMQNVRLGITAVCAHLLLRLRLSHEYLYLL